MVKTNYKVLEQAHKFRLHGVKREGYPATPHATFGTFLVFLGLEGVIGVRFSRSGSQKNTETSQILKFAKKKILGYQKFSGSLIV